MNKNNIPRPPAGIVGILFLIYFTKSIINNKKTIESYTYVRYNKCNKSNKGVINMEKGIITLDCVRYESNFEQGEQVGTLHLYDKTFKLYQNEEIGLQFIDNGETQNLLTMINEEDYKTVIDEIINHLFKDISPKKFKVHIISTSSNK